MASEPHHRIAIRSMTTADLREVRRIERAAYGTNLPGTPFERELQNGLAQYIVAVRRRSGPAAPPRAPTLGDAIRRLLRFGAPEEPVLGFLGLWYTVDQLHIVTIAVAPDRQHQGIAQRLLLEAYRLAIEAEMKSIALEVRPSNARARRLYQWFGFEQMGTLRAYYSDNGEDAVIMLTPDLATPDYLERIRYLRDQHERKYGARFAPAE
jgi:ribosomal-protein-alanine acetyltransferase